MLSLVLLSATLSSAPVQVAVVRSVGVKPSESASLVMRLQSALEDARLRTEKLEPAEAVERCRGARQCLRRLVRGSGGRVLVEVELGWVAGQLGAKLGAFDDGGMLASHQFIVGGERFHLTLGAELARFAQALHARVGPLPVPEDTPAVVVLTPNEVKDESPLLSPGATRVVRGVAFGGAALATVSAAVLGGLGLSARNQLMASYTPGSDGVVRSSLDQRTAASLASTSNARFTGLWVSAGVAVGLAAFGLLLPSAAEDAEE